MKRHAKKSLWIPLLAFVSIIAIVACCYSAQSFSAYADDGNFKDNFDRESKLNSLLDSKDITARIHLSTNDIFGGTVTDSIMEPESEFISFSGEEWVTFKDAISVVYTLDKKSKSENTEIINIFGMGKNGLVGPFYSIKLPTYFYSYSGVSLNYTASGSSVDVSILVEPSCFICFNANGGEFDDESSTKWVAQGQFNNVKFPETPVFITKKMTFSGWYTHPIWGDRIDENTQVYELDRNIVLYAHWIDPEKSLVFNFSTQNFGQKFQYDFVTYNYEWDWEDEEKGTTWSYSKELTPDDLMFSHSYKMKVDKHGNAILELYWESVDHNYVLTISPIEGQRFNNVSINDGEIDMISYLNSNDSFKNLPVSQINNTVLSPDWSIPGYVSVASDNGGQFKCNITKIKEGDIVNSEEFNSDSISVLVDSDAYVEYKYGASNPNFVMLSNGENDASSGAMLTLRVYDISDKTYTIYKFCDNLFSLFDWFDINTYIKGLVVDGQSISYSTHMHSVNNGLHSFVLQMDGQDTHTSVTYNANGGSFSEGSASITLDAVYGEALPAVENPTLAENDFVGWFTEAEGGQQVDPANYKWNPWDRWNGVTLYAHWAYNPQPVPPEPVPPEPVPPVPGPTPDNPGGAQTGDTAGIALAIAAMLALCGACGVATTARIRKKGQVLI